MGILDALKELIGIGPVSGRALNERATHAVTEQPRPSPTRPVGIEITPEYEMVLYLLESNYPIVLVTGQAGTGKSTLINFARRTLKKRVAVVAPTGAAALQAEAATIHSFFRFPPRAINADDIKAVDDRTLYTKIEVLIVDEISMVRADLMDAVDSFLRLNRHQPETPFGGVQLLLVGDPFQLPPVVQTQEEGLLFGRRYTSPFFFSSHVLQECQIVSIELQRNFRQRDEEFVALLSRLRVGEDVEQSIQTINNTCQQNEHTSEQRITLTCTNAAAHAINDRKLKSLPGRERLYNGTVTGRFNLEKERLPAPMELKLKRGAQVVFVKNDTRKRWMNGTLGIVERLQKDVITVRVQSPPYSGTHEVDRVDWARYVYRYDFRNDSIKSESTGSFRQFPLAPAWAITIHKSQGATLQKVHIDFGQGTFAPGQAYVALSRCRSLRDITLARPLKLTDVQTDESIRHFYFALADLQKAH